MCWHIGAAMDEPESHGPCDEVIQLAEKAMLEEGLNPESGLLQDYLQAAAITVHGDPNETKEDYVE